MNIADYKGVWVFAEQRDGELQKVSFELLGKGREIADKLGEELTAVLLGDKTDDMAKELVAFGADKVIVARSVHYLVILQLMHMQKLYVILQLKENQK